MANVSPALSLTLTWLTPGQVDFRRILGRRDIDARLVEDVEAGVQRHGLAATGRAGDQDHAVRPLDRVQQASFC